MKVGTYLEGTVDGELSSSDGTDHEETSTDTTEGSTETELTSDLDETAGGRLTWKTLGLVDLGKHGVGWLGDDGGGETSDETGSEVDDSLGSTGGSGFVNALPGSLGDLLVTGLLLAMRANPR